jgi:hypothetical protein
MACPGEEVIGMIYRCKPSTVDTMSEYEGGYERKTVLVVSGDGSSVEAVIYVAMEKNVVADAQSSDEYLTRIVTGAAQQRLPEDYIEKIRLLASACED